MVDKSFNQSPFTQTPEPPRKKISAKWYVLLGLGAFLTLTAAYIFRILTPPAPAPIQDNSWKEVTPGYSSVDDVISKLGQPSRVQQDKQGTRLYYTSDFPDYPNEVAADPFRKVQLITEYVGYDPNHTLNQYSEKYGQPDISLFDSRLSGATKVHVFLKPGLAVVVNNREGTVEQIWYFSPTTKEAFMAEYGSTMSEEGEGPEGVPNFVP